MISTLQAKIRAHGLPDDFLTTVETYYLPIADDIAARAHETIVVGIQGCQGSGKSTAADFLKHILESKHRLKTAVLSIDDFYLTRSERQNLAQSIHPLFLTRGVPGTHDVELAIQTIKRLCELGSNESHSIPRFNKALDDRAAKKDWDTISGPINIIIFEGWCVGLSAQDENELASPINDLERTEDSNGAWRNYVNKQLANVYPDLFGLLNFLAVLKAPSFDVVKEWRLLQEQKLIQQLKNAGTLNNTRTMSELEIQRFISHYQRLTEVAIDTLPRSADWLLHLGNDHSISKLENRMEKLNEY